MSYNNRNYGRPQQQQQNSRYNTPGQFVSAGELNSPATPSRTTRSTAASTFSNLNDPYVHVNNLNKGPSALYPVGTNPPPPPPQAAQPSPAAQPPLPPAPLAVSAQQFQAKASQQNYGNTEQAYGNTEQAYGNTEQSYGNTSINVDVLPKVESMDVTTDSASTFADNGAESKVRPAWMKAGIRKISTKERRRRQNEHLRKLLTPKNALMVLNEMMPGEQISSNFTVEAAPPSNMFFRQEAGHKFCAGLALDGQLYKGFGENKLTARNAAAEQAIRDLVIKRMAKALNAANTPAEPTLVAADGNGEGGSAAEGTAATGEEVNSLPMIQLASYALHKLFSEWQYEGFEVPLLKKTTTDSTSAAGDKETLMPAAPKPKPPKKPKELPAEAAAMHPSMLLTQMRPGATYNELGCEGDKPQNMCFTMGVTVDGTTYIGKASNKKEARKLAARSACTALFNVQFAE